MTKRVYKYDLSFNGPTRLELTGPIVHVDVVHSEVRVWAEAGVHAPRVRTFEVFGTGHPISSLMQHVATTVDRQLGLVWHVYEPKS